MNSPTENIGSNAPKNPFEKMYEAIRRGLIARDGSHRQNPHHRMHTKKYSDGRQRRGRAHFLSKRVGANFVKPQPSEKARQRAEKRGGKDVSTQVGEPVAE